MNLAITLQWNEPFAEIAAFTIPAIQRYADKHGYKFFPKKHDLVSPDIVWQRLDDVLDVIDEFDAVVHLDADMLITNHEVKIHGLLEFDPNSDYFSGIGLEGNPNDGFSIWTNKKASMSAIRYCKQMRDSKEFSSPQAVMSHGQGYHGAVIHYLPQRTCNSYICSEYGWSAPNSEWGHGDFILHLPAIGTERRLEILNQHLHYAL